MPPPSGITGRVRFAGFLDRAARARRAAPGRLLREPRGLRDRAADPARGHGLRHARGEHRHRARGRDGPAAAAAAVRAGAGGHGSGDRGHARRCGSCGQPSPRGARTGRGAGIAGSGSSTGSEPSTGCGRSVRHDPAAAGATSRRGGSRSLCQGFTAERSPAAALARGRRDRAGLSRLGPRRRAVHRCGRAIRRTPYAVESCSALLTRGQASAELRAALQPRPVDRVFMLTAPRSSPGCADWIWAHRCPWSWPAHACGCAELLRLGLWPGLCASARCWRCRCSTRSCPGAFLRAGLQPVRGRQS